MLGIGSRHYGWMNYAESPGFYIGMLPLLLIPQLWKGTTADRRIFIAGGTALGLFVFIPAIRYLAFGFTIDYFRVNNLWVSMLLLTLFARALEVVAKRGVDGHLVGTTVAVLALVLATIQTGLLPLPSNNHKLRLAVLASAGLILIALLNRKHLAWTDFSTAALILICADAVLVNYPSYNWPYRQVVTRDTPSYGSDGSIAAVAYLKARDSGFYRIEKTFDTVSFCDSLVQGYMGVKSYALHGAGVVGYFTDLELLPQRNRLKNYTNWLPNYGDRFALNTLAGVKYLLARKPFDWPGFRRIHEVAGVLIYENELALPLGVVYEQWYPRNQIGQLAPKARDLAMINAAIVDLPRSDASRMFNAGRLMNHETEWLDENYIAPVQLLKGRGLVIEKFSDGHIVGKVESDVAGILVMSIPYSKGWSVAIDGEERPAFSANLGMLAADIAAGPHRIELRYSLPGFITGLCVGAIGFLGMLFLITLGRREKSGLA
jgi:uncharacterized membrane protein YfhO